MKNSVRYVISGKVQGVYYRAETQAIAQKLKLTGVVRNLRDGRVEVIANGENTQHEFLYQWLCLGPRLACVNEVTREIMPYQELVDFQIGNDQ
jgi:acylphosphatase